MQQCLSRPARNGERTRVRLRVLSPALALRPAGSLGRSHPRSPGEHEIGQIHRRLWRLGLRLGRQHVVQSADDLLRALEGHLLLKLQRRQGEPLAPCRQGLPVEHGPVEGRPPCGGRAVHAHTANLLGRLAALAPTAEQPRHLDPACLRLERVFAGRAWVDSFDQSLPRRLEEPARLPGFRLDPLVVCSRHRRGGEEVLAQEKKETRRALVIGTESCAVAASEDEVKTRPARSGKLANLDSLSKAFLQIVFSRQQAVHLARCERCERRDL
mmetsp:Transcript_23056/g.67837  ORF Transcript_23056/g.67837 Transcript_23056/m.67837 type:complete len:270 (-) Transcript_23056:64-873(-)